MTSYHRVLTAALVLAVLAIACATVPASVDRSDDDLDQLVDWMTGSFSSAAQAADDEGYFDIRLEVVPIWTDRDDGRWLYVEQAAASSLEAPYRQRVYRVVRRGDRPGDELVSEVYSLPDDPLRFAGAFEDPSLLGDLEPEALEEREGCAVVLRRVDAGTFRGSTVEDDCVSVLRGASYATSEVEVTVDGLTSWDRGFDAEGVQVWGAVEGPYEFRRVD